MTVKKGAAADCEVDALLAQASEVARQALAPVCPETEIGIHMGVKPEGSRLLTHRFECLKTGYVGWEWTVTLARPPRGRKATICEVNLLPGEGALLAPPWIPWEDRLEPGDLSRYDTIAYRENDVRLDQSYELTGEDADAFDPYEIGLGRPRALSQTGRDRAATRWYAGERGPLKLGGRDAQNCATCGFLMKMGGSFRTMFGVCANEWAQDDGCVVSFDHSCGAHSETDVPKRASAWAVVPPHVDEVDLEIVATQPLRLKTGQATGTDSPENCAEESQEPQESAEESLETRVGASRQ
ncbi:MAG: DUF3027 domain-containing protein [Actinomycetaceae bacterium]|nr:DUF3027 domain-containing protein [Actinomycetaceae bacterium]